MNELDLWTMELVDGDYRDCPDPDDFKAEPEREWPEDMPWELGQD